MGFDSDFGLRIFDFGALPAPAEAGTPVENLSIEEKLRKYHDLISRIDATLADPAVFTKDPAKAALLSAQRGELERLLILAEEEWLSLTGALDEAREAAMRIE